MLEPIEPLLKAHFCEYVALRGSWSRFCNFHELWWIPFQLDPEINRDTAEASVLLQQRLSPFLGAAGVDEKDARKMLPSCSPAMLGISNDCTILFKKIGTSAASQAAAHEEARRHADELLQLCEPQSSKGDDGRCQGKTQKSKKYMRK